MMSNQHPLAEEPFSGKLTAVDLKTGQQVTIDLTEKQNVSRSFKSGDALDRIRDVLHLPETPTLDTCRADEEEINYLLRVAKSSFSTLYGWTFDDLFPPTAIEDFVDDDGRHIPEALLTNYYGGAIHETQHIIIPDREAKISSRRALYFRLISLPKFAAWLADAFSTCLYHERELVKQRHAEAEQFCKEISDAFADGEVHARGCSQGEEDDIEPPFPW